MSDLTISKTQALLREMRRLLALGWPIMGAQLLWLSMVVVDNVMIGHLGERPLAALAMASGLFGIFNITTVGVLSALSPLISQAHGADRPEEIGRVARQALSIAICLALFTILGFALARPLLELAGQDPELTPLAREYLLAVAWGIPAQSLYLMLRHVTEATGDTRPSVIIAALAASANVVLDYALIYGKFGLPALGVRGAGYATAAVSCFMAAALLVYIARRPRYRAFGLFRGTFRPDWSVLRQILALGLPMSGAMLAEMSFFVSSTLLVGTIGAREIAAHQIALNAASFVFMIPLGLSFAVSIRIGHLVGKGDRPAVSRAGWAGAALAVVIGSLTASLFLLLPERIVGIYTTDLELAAVAAVLLKIAGIFQIVDGLQVVGMGMLRGLKETRAPFLATVTAFWIIGFPTCWLLGLTWDYGPTGVWIGLLLGLSLAAAAHQWRFWRLTRAA